MTLESFESIGHLLAKQYLRNWLIEEYQSDRRTVWLEYPFFTDAYYQQYFSGCAPVDLLDEFCKQSLEQGCTYRVDVECPCVRCQGLRPKFIADVVVRHKSGLFEIWEVVNKSDLSGPKFTYYQYLKEIHGITFHTIPDIRIMHQLEGKLPSLSEFRKDHAGVK